MLKPKCVFILDCTSELFVWIGKKASRLLKMAGQKMATEFHQIIERPEFCTICREIEGEESTVFRSKFSSWDDIVPFDFTMTADTVQRRGADIKVIMERDKMKTDLVALFLDRLPTMPHEEADQLIEDFNLDLEVIESFVLVFFKLKKFLVLVRNFCPQIFHMSASFPQFLDVRKFHKCPQFVSVIFKIERIFLQNPLKMSARKNWFAIDCGIFWNLFGNI
ncbi:unnamed protein product [Meloidogyne enterolobii]|uniref:Uncharacterized protein n=1 Tax=Meloidogyne enterolobii TaxID=390850 RepID=A0ACB0ZDM4_MELEN